MKREWRHSWVRSSRPLWIALPLLIFLLSVGGYLLTSQAIDRDRDATAERRARAESVETQQILGRARAYVQGLSNVLASERRPGQTRFATLAAGTAASVGLDDVLWIEAVPGAARRGYERRLRAPIRRLTSSGRVVRAPDAASYLPATFTSESRPELRPGVDVSNFPGLADAVGDRATVFAVGASKPGALGDEPGFYLLESASFGRTRGFLAAFVPRGWFVTTIGEDPRRVAISLEGRRIEGQLSSGAGSAGFETLGRRWEIDVGREPPSSLQSTLPWLALAWPVAIALIAFLVGRAVMLRRRAEREASGMFERSTDVLASAGFDGYYRRVNPAFVRTLGYSNAEMLSKPYSDFVHPDDVERTREAFDGMVRGGEEVIGFENRWICADGSVRWIQWNVRRALDEDVMYGVGRDVTESRRAERQFEEIFNVSPDLLCIIGLDGYFKRVNSAFEEAFGYSSEELLSRPVLEFGHPDDLPMARDMFERAARGETVTRFENRNIRADGTYLWMEWTARPLPEEGVIYAAARDITERKRADDEQAALRRVATLVAEGASPQDLFEAVTEEVGRVLPVDSATMGRFEPDNSLTMVASSRTARSTSELAFVTGTRWPAEGTNVASIVLQTGRSARIDDFSAATDPIGVTAREAGIKSAVGSPIVVKGHLWGVMGANSTEGPMPPDTEGRLASFTELVATAIANAESRAELDVHVEQQAALRRVATLVAEDVPPGEIISAMAEEIGRIALTEAVHIYRYEPDGTAVRVAAWSEVHQTLPLGERIPPGGLNLAAMVWETGRAARLDDVSEVTGSVTEIVQRLDLRAAVASPIVVEGRLWGVVTGGTSKPGPMPADTEDRIADFTELVATAIANAESRAQLDVHAAQQAALRRVATLVAEDVPPKELFEAVAREVGTLLGGDFSGLARFEGNAVFPVGVWAAEGEHPPFPLRWEMQPGDPATRIAETRGPIRSDDWTGEPGPIAEFIRAMGIRSTVGTPIVVEGRLWGALALHSKQAAPLPPDTEPRMAQFTDLVATAIANREARAEVTRLADEQAALRRVATLVVRGVRPNEIFSTVAMELRRLFGADIATVARFEEDRSIAILVGQAQAPDAPPLKTRWEVTPPLATAEVARTGRPARTEGHHMSTVSGETADEMRRMGVSSAVASPVIVEGDLWGVITVSTSTEPLPPGADERVTDFTDLVATAIANAKSRSELEASRARVVAASAEERRRVVRDLHDGAQQRLVHAVISLKLALRELRSGDPRSEDYVTEALDHAEQANSELRELVHGILPGVLTSGGLRAGVEDLVSRGSLPVDVDVSVNRFPPAVEATAYFVVSEALTNAVKHSRAQAAHVAARVDNGYLRVEVRDDGVGGADPGRGSGLTGLRDRVEALGGKIAITSPPGSGTSLVAEIPADG